MPTFTRPAGHGRAVRTPASRRLRLLLALPLLAATIGAPVLAAPAAAAATDLTSLVNPFIGSENDGNTYPGAAVPFGEVQLSPDTGHNTGYSYGDDHIRGFSMIHLSGVGCGLGGDLPVLPTTGDVTSTDYGSYAATYSHDGEVAHPGYYKVPLTSSGITAELTATTHTGWQRYTFPATDKANVLINTGQALHDVLSSSVRVLNDRTVLSTVRGEGFCQSTKPYTTYFVTRFDRPFTSVGTWSGDTVTAGSKHAATKEGHNGAYVRFDTTTDHQVTATTAISYVDSAGAVRNLAVEGGGTFDSVRAAAQQTWEKQLELVKVAGGSSDQQKTFYSSLYRSFLTPNTGTDVDGRYTGWDQKIHHANGFTYYQNFSLWDTYRTQQQLLSLLAPRQARDMALSVLTIQQQGGWLPRWGYGTVETNIMTGDPVTPWLVDAYTEGLLRGHEAQAYRALKQNADGVPPKSSPYNGRAGNRQYIANGFVPYEPDATGKPGDYDLQHGPSATLEYALADCSMSQIAGDLGHTADATRYSRRAQSWTSILDPATGYFRARDADGMFAGPTDPKNSVGFHEGTSPQYMWLVQQNMPGLIKAIGGSAVANDRLDSFFAYDQLLKDPSGTARNVWINGPYAYYNADKYNPQNEPDLHAPYTYLWTGEPYKTTDVVHAAIGLFTDGPDGMTGNDDLGTMSAWHVLSSMGVYPIAPGTDVWGLSTPIFSSVDITLDKSWYHTDHLSITAPGSSATDRYTQSVSLAGRSYHKSWITGADLRAGKSIDFTVGSTPSSWGTHTVDEPPAFCTTPQTTSHVSAAVTPAAPEVASTDTATSLDLTADIVAQSPESANGLVRVTAPAALQVSDTKQTWSAHSGGLPATVAAPLRITVPAGTPAGTYDVTVAVTSSQGAPTVHRTVPVQVVTTSCTESGGSCAQDLSASYDLDGVASVDASSQGNFDGSGWSFPAEVLPAAGPTLLGGHSYDMPSTSGTDDNFVTAAGQTVPLTAGSYSRLDLLASAHNGTQSGTATVHYADGSTSAVTLTAADWASSTPAAGQDAAIACPYRIKAGQGQDTPPVNIWHSAVALDAGKQAVSITLPDLPDMAVYAMSGTIG